METIEIPVTDYYFARDLYPLMPRPVFDALESAYLEGRATASVPAQSFREFQRRAGVC